MQLQRVCNHPELVVPRETSSSYFCPSVEYNVPSLVLGAIETDPSKVVPHTQTPWIIVRKYIFKIYGIYLLNSCQSKHISRLESYPLKEEAVPSVIDNALSDCLLYFPLHFVKV